MRDRRWSIRRQWWFWILSAFLCCCAITTSATPLQDQTPELKRRQQELRKTRKIIQRLQRKLQTLHQKEQHLTTQLGLYQKQLHYVGQYIELLQQEMEQLQWAIAATHMRYDTLQQKLEQLRAAFRTVIQRLYRDRPLSAEEFLVLPEHLQAEARVRKYSQQLLALANQQAKRILQMQDSLDCVAFQLEQQWQQWSKLLAEYQQQQQHYQQMQEVTQQLLQQVRRNRSQIARQLEQRKRSARMLQTIIAKLEQEQRKVYSGRKRNTQQSNAILRSLRWPTKSRRIVQPYGSYRNPQTGVTVDNIGIGIGMPRGSPVYAAAGGVVSLVHWLPGYGTVVIIDHGSGIRTVYANLSKAYVVEGQVVRQSEEIGESGSSVDGEYLHFEVWNGTQSIDPRKFLR